MEVLGAIWAVILLLILIIVFGANQPTSRQILKKYRKRQGR